MLRTGRTPFLALLAALTLPNLAAAAIQKPCADGVPAGVYHAYSECHRSPQGNFWYVVTDAYYNCPPNNVVQAFRIEETATTQTCDQPAPNQTSLVRELGFGDQSAQADGSFVFLECVSGFWYRVTYQRHRLPDGSIRISRPATNLENTLVPCADPRPPLVAAASGGTATGGTKSVTRPARVTRSLSGVVVAARQTPAGQDKLMIAAPPKARDAAVDEIRVELPKKSARAATPLELPAGWSMNRDRKGLVFAGPPATDDKPLTIQVDLGGEKAPPAVAVDLVSRGQVVEHTNATVSKLPGQSKKGDSSSAALPPAAAPGQEVTFSLAPTLVPGWATLLVSDGTTPVEATPAPAGDGHWEVDLPETWQAGSTLTLTANDPWGGTILEEPFGTQVIAPPAATPEQPAISGATPTVLVGNDFCVCGWFPTAAARNGVALGGTPLGPPVSASPEVLIFSSADLKPGATEVAGDAGAGFGSDARAALTMISIGGAVDRNKLLRGESTPVQLWVEGTTKPVKIELENKTPGIVSLAGGEEQTVTTSGGADNRVERTLNAVSPGDFNLSYTVEGTACPCSEGSLPRGDGETATLADDAIAAFRKGREAADRARNGILFGEGDPATAAKEALDALAHARDLLQSGIDDGSIGPNLAETLGGFITEYEEQARNVVETAPPTPPLVTTPTTADNPLGLRYGDILIPDKRLESDWGLSLGVTYSWNKEWGDDPRDVPPPTTYGEEVDDGPVGILLVRVRDSWIPSYVSRTAVVAKIYEPDPARPGVWLPSDTKERVMTVRFVERSNEPGQCMNADLPEGPQDSPDLSFDKHFSGAVHCSDDPTGRGHFGTCVTDSPHNEKDFWILSEDYGGFSKLEASCDGCVQLVPVWGGREIWPPAVAEPVREKRLLRVPQDTNDNQIADHYPPEAIEFMHADEDSDDAPTGDGTDGDGYSAYEEYRGFITDIGIHQRSDWKTKTLVVQNTHGFPIDLFRSASGLEVIEVDADGLRDRVANFNHHHAHLVDQHANLLRRGSLPKGVAGMSYGFGPPKGVEKVVIKMGTYASSDLVAHELGHSVGMHHHGDSPWDISKDPNSDEFKEEIRAMTGGLGDLLPGRVHSGSTLCGKTLPALFSVGEKGDQSSGDTSCIMRYRHFKDVYKQDGGDYDCMPYGLSRALFCDSPAGTGPNGFDRTAGDASVGNCKGQIIVNDTH